MDTMIRPMLVKLPIFEGLTDVQLGLLQPLLKVCQFPADTVIFEQGQFADHLFILEAGEVHIRFKPYDGPPLIVARIFPGSIFGWSAALGRQTYTSAAMAVVASCAYRLRSSDLHILCEQHPEEGAVVLKRLASAIAERLNDTQSQILNILKEGMELKGDGQKRNITNG